MRPIVKVWFDKGGFWHVAFEDGTVRQAGQVNLDACVTQYKADGFMELQPGGPRGIVVGELVAMVDWVAEA